MDGFGGADAVGADGVGGVRLAAVLYEHVVHLFLAGVPDDSAAGVLAGFDAVDEGDGLASHAAPPAMS